MKKFFLLLIILLFILFLYAKYIEPTNLIVKEYSIYNDKLPEGFNGIKIVQFSDVLYRNQEDLELLENVVENINDQNPDIIVFTGNLTNNKINNQDTKDILNTLSKLKANLAMYTISGDKDTANNIDILENSGFTYLNNSYEYLFNNDITPILVIGGNNLTEDILPINENINYEYILTLISKPDYYDEIKNSNPSLVLAGYSLGGQIRIPFWGSLIKEDGARKYTDEFYNNETSALYNNFGIGLGKLNLRLFNSPSINVYRLYSK